MHVAEVRDWREYEKVDRCVEGVWKCGLDTRADVGTDPLDGPPEKSEDGAEQEAVFHGWVDLAEDALGTDGAPDDGRGEVDLRTVLAVELLGLVGGADADDIVVNELDDSVADEGSDDGGHELAAVHGAGRDFGVEAHFLVGDVVVGLAVDVVTVGLDEHESLWVTGKGVSDDELRHDVETFGCSGNGVEVSHGNEEDEVQTNDEEDGPNYMKNTVISCNIVQNSLRNTYQVS